MERTNKRSNFRFNFRCHLWTLRIVRQWVDVPADAFKMPVMMMMMMLMMTLISSFSVIAAQYLSVSCRNSCRSKSASHISRLSESIISRVSRYINAVLISSSSSSSSNLATMVRHRRFTVEPSYVHDNRSVAMQLICFRCAAPCSRPTEPASVLWNLVALVSTHAGASRIVLMSTLPTFRRHLKRYLFCRCYNTIWSCLFVTLTL